MGDPEAGWHLPAVEVLESAFREFESFKGAAFSEFFEPVEISYGAAFADLRKTWKADVAGIKGVLATQIDAKDAAEKKKVEKRLDDVSTAILAGEDDFFATHAMDVVLYRFFSLVRNRVNVMLAEKFLESAGSEFKSWSIVAHSLGTAVTHNSLHALYNTPNLGGMQGKLSPDLTRPKVLMMVANVSRVLQLPTLKAFDSAVRPGPAVSGCLCGTYLNVRHKLDPFTFPQPFDPDPIWPDVTTSHSLNYQHIRPGHLLISKAADVHDLDHYLRNPLVHAALFRAILGTDLISDLEIEKKSLEFDAATDRDNTNSLRHLIESKLPAPSDDWTALIKLLLESL